MAGLLPDWLADDEALPAGGLLGGLGNWLGNNSSTLMGLGAGIVGGRSWGEGLSKGFQHAMTGMLDLRRAVHDQTVAALMQRGLDATTARAAAGNPAVLRAMLPELRQPQSRPQPTSDQRAVAPTGGSAGFSAAPALPPLASEPAESGAGGLFDHRFAQWPDLSSYGPTPPSLLPVSYRARTCDQAFDQCKNVSPMSLSPMSLSRLCYESWKTCNSNPGLPIVFPGGVWVPSGSR